MRVTMTDIDTSKLVSTILSLENYYDASSALEELSSADSEKAEELALDILTSFKGDVQLQAYAFTILYSVNRAKGFDFIKCRAHTTDPYIFKSMLDSVTEDSSLIGDIPDLAAVVKLLSGELEKMDSHNTERIGATVDWFKSSYRNQLY